MFTAATAACGGAAAKLGVGEPLELGEKYLLEEDYEQAVLRFTRLIEIEPKNPRGYTGLAEAYIGLDDIDKAIEILLQGFEIAGAEDISSRLRVLLATPHRFSYPDENGNDVVVYGQRDIEGRLQGFCILNIFDQATSEIIFLAEGDYADGVLRGDSKMWWIDENTKNRFGRDKGYGFGVGPFVDGARYGFTTIECFLDISIKEVPVGEMYRFTDCSGLDMIYAYRGNMVSDGREDTERKDDASGSAYEMWISERTGEKVEYTGQFRNNARDGYGRMVSDGGWVYEGAFENGDPVGGWPG
jgi:tetratricopeptide (TPR) repeat protein